MSKQTAHIEIYRAGSWQLAATLTSIVGDKGYQGECEFEYDTDYAIANINADDGNLSCRYPVILSYSQLSKWPAFLLDILPSGFGRDQWLLQLGLANNHKADWPLLLAGAACPPGNIRITEAAAARKPALAVPAQDGEIVSFNKHAGFTLDAITGRQEHFIEYAAQNDAYVSGASDVQGAAPKFMMVQDHADRWHAEGALADNQIASHWLIKFPRGKKTADDKLVLKTEAAYMKVAKDLGLKVHADLIWDNDTLLIPRFDRVVIPGQPVIRQGMESLCSLAGISDYAVPIPQQTLCEAIAEYATDPTAEVLEFVMRDIVNIVLGNKDNHARNNAVFRLADGTVTFTPLYDVAPMYLDPEGIARVCRWSGEAEQAGRPVWENVIECLPGAVDKDLIRGRLKEFATAIERLPNLMKHHDIDPRVIDRCVPFIEENAKQLRALTGNKPKHTAEEEEA